MSERERGGQMTKGSSVLTYVAIAAVVAVVGGIIAGWYLFTSIDPQSASEADAVGSDQPPMLLSNAATAALSDDPASAKPAGARATAPRPAADHGGASPAEAVREVGAEAVVAAMRPHFRDCYTQGLKADPELQGYVTLSANIGPDGSVLGVTGGEGSALEPILGCLKAVVRGGDFRPPRSGDAAISIPISFVKQR